MDQQIKSTPNSKGKSFLPICPEWGHSLIAAHLLAIRIAFFQMLIQLQKLKGF